MNQGEKYFDLTSYTGLSISVSNDGRMFEKHVPKPPNIVPMGFLTMEKSVHVLDS